jgi:hypothetical protein
MSRGLKGYLSRLKAAILHAYQCRATHIQTFPVVEVFRGKVVWEGDVELFKLYAPKFGEGCYAWGFFDDKGDWEADLNL